MKFNSFSVFLTIFFASQLHGHQLKHPHELDMSGLEDEINQDLLKWTSKQNSVADCALYYRRIVKYLFDQKRFKSDPVSDLFIANIPLRLKREQWELLVDNNIDGLNMIEVDDLLAEVLKQSNDENWEYPVAQILYEHYKQQLIMSLPTFDSSTVRIILALLAILVTCRFFKFSKLTFSALIVAVIFGLCALSYSMAYYDCLGDLEVEQMIKLSKQQSPSNPCKDYHGERESFWSSISAAILGSSENNCLEHMRNTFKSTKKYCDPLDVFARWFGKIQMSYFSTIVGGFMEIIGSMSASSNFITRTVFWVIAAAIFVYIFLSFGKVVIKSSFSGIFDVLKTNVAQKTPQEPNHELRALSCKMDEILHENQQMKRELSIIRECSEERSSQGSPPKIEEKKRLEGIEESPENKES